MWFFKLNQATLIGKCVQNRWNFKGGRSWSLNAASISPRRLEPHRIGLGGYQGQLAKIEIDSNLDFSVEKWVNCDKHVQSIEN